MNKMISKRINRVKIEIYNGNIAEQQGYTAIVNAANAELLPGGGVAGAIHRAAGPGLAEECRHLAPIRPGQAVITKGYDLPNKYVIHTLGPVYGKDKPEDELLRNCYVNSLKVADENNVDSIAFPAISTGIFGYPIKEAAEIALKTIIELIPELRNVNSVRMVLYSRGDYEVHEKIFKALTGEV